MKIKVFTFTDGGIATVTMGKSYSQGANIDESSQILINKQKPIKEEILEVPDDFYEKFDEFELLADEKGKIKYKHKPKDKKDEEK